MGYNKQDNLINYCAGPIYFSVCGWKKTIVISTNSKWSYLLPDVLAVCKIAWKIKEDTRIERADLFITIFYDFEIINNYLETSIMHI